MAIISGVNGAVYHFAELGTTAAEGVVTYTTAGIETPATTAAINFESIGFEVGHFITIAGSATTAGANNNGYFTVSAVTTNSMDITEAAAQFSTGCDTGTPTISEKEPGIEKMGFYNWTLNYNNEIYDATNFKDSSGGRTYVAGITNWDATADKYFLSTGSSLNSWVNTTVKARFFMKYVATPTTGDTAQYFEGDTIVKGIGVNTPVDALVSQTVTFQGKGALTETLRSTPWTT